MSEKNKWALSAGALERPLGPICSLAPDGSADLFFRSFDRVADFTEHINK